MPLSEFLRMASGKVEDAEQKSTNRSTDLSSLHEDDLAELVWNNGQVMMQSQSNRAKRNPAFNQFPTEAPGMRDNSYLGNTSNYKAAKFAAVQSFMDDAAPSVPSAEILNQDNDIEPWLNSSIDDGCAQAYFSDLLPEISGVTAANEPSLYGSFALMNKRNDDGKFGHSQNVPMNIRVNSELQNSSSTGLFKPYESNHCELSVPLMGSRVSHFNSLTQNSHVFFGNSNQGQTSEKSFMGRLPEKHSIGASGSGPRRLLNFTNISRPASLYRSDLQKSDGLDASCSSAIKRTQNVDKIPAVNSCILVKSTNFQPSSTRKEMGSCNEINLVSTKADSGPSVVKSPVKPCSDEPPDSVCPEDSIKNDKLLSCDADVAKGFTVGDKMAEPLLAASSVCSGNSAEMASNDQTHKRKDRDNEESDSRSEDNEEESVGKTKVAPGRGVSGSKRSRAAEVHNLSERRRRDRINEKMRALQELIPNCNKADKASMLDEAIEYLKNLQLQVQVMSMGAGFCMPPMMFPTALPHMHAAHMPHFPQVGGGMGFGMGMLDINSGVPRFPVFPMSTMQGARFSSSPMYGPNVYQGLAGQNFQFYGLPAQGLPLSVPRAPPLFPSSGQPPVSSTGVSNTQQVGIHVDATKTYPVICSDASLQNKSLQPVSDACARSTTDRIPCQSEAVTGAFDHPSSIQKDDQVLDACGTTSAKFTNMKKDDVSSKEGGH